MDRIRIGIIGCGTIAQIQHLPNLRELDDQFEIAAICDLSHDLLKRVGDDYGVPAGHRYSDHQALIEADIDAVIVCPSGTHAPATIAAAEAGKHALVEKPACFLTDEARAMARAAERSGVVVMIAYMKRHDPAYKFALERVRAMTDVSFVQVNHLHPDNSLHTAEFRTHAAGDVNPDGLESLRSDTNNLIDQALGLDAAPDDLRRAFTLVNGSLIHDIGNLHGMFGPPERVLSTEIWLGGRAVTTVLEYGSGVRAVLNWVDLPELYDFKETLEVYGSCERVVVSFPTGFSRGLPTRMTISEIDGEINPSKRELEWHENSFKNELAHFGECIRDGRDPLTPASEIIDDVALVRDIIQAWRHPTDGRDG